MQSKHTDSDIDSEEETRLRITPFSSPKSGTVATKNERTGLNSPIAMSLMILWYIFSACNLFMNKYVISYLNGEPALLAMGQMLMCIVFGFIQIKHSCGLFASRPSSTSLSTQNGYKFMQPSTIILGTLRFTTLVLALTSLNYVAVSFIETIKSSAPIFTVIITAIFIGEKTGLYVNLSLVPIMSGLAICSATELSFNIEGFVASILTNLSECIQNVYSKVLLSNERQRNGPAELQFNTSLASFVIQLIASFAFVDWATVELSSYMIGAILVNGMFFHFQSITEYALLEHITPVTHSVANTVKRAFLIWISVFLFGNTVTFYSGLGTLCVIGGVLLYNKARQLDAHRNHQRIIDFQPCRISL